ncbi:glycosyltransferase family 4 protein, partial [Azospirillum sp. YIM DDC1]
WQEKRRAIQHAAAHVMISHNSARDLERLFPCVAAGSTAVAPCGVGEAFRPAEAAEVAAFRKAHGLDRPYVLMVGDRTGYQGYKNGLLLFRALGLRDPTTGGPATRDLTVLCVGGAKEVEPMFRELAPEVPVVRLSVSDEELRLAYAGAEALAYPSRYEGFGMPVVEAMACGCPVITCANSSLIEVAGDAALFVGEDDAAGMAAAIAAVRDPQRRAGLVARGLEQAARFTFDAMARTMADALTDAARRIGEGTLPKPTPVWNEVKRLLVEKQTLNRENIQLRAEAAVAVRTAGPGDESSLSAPSPGNDTVPELKLELLRCQSALATTREALESIQNSPFWLLRRMVLGVLYRAGVRRRG